MAPPPWPLFDLVLRTPRLVLRSPTDDDLAGLLDAVDAGIHDPDEMPFSIPWTDAPPEERRISAMQHWWSNRANWSPDNWHLALAVFLDGAPVGVQSVLGRKFAILKEVETGSWLTRSVQGRGIGKEMRAAVLNLAFDGLGAVYARSGAFTHNAGSLGVSRALGYREDGRRREAPRGEPAEMIRLVITREEWMGRREQFAPTSIEGLEACRSMFG